MCRFFAYAGAPVWIDSLILDPEFSLVRQSMAARKAKTVVNGDGCGLGWYGARGEPGLYRDTQPAWSDANLDSLSRQIHSGLFLAHVRSATSGAVARANCHPFRLGRHLFMHNGQIGGYARIRRVIEAMISDRVYDARTGTTDSEALFLIAAGLGLEADPPAAVARALSLAHAAAREAGVTEAFRFSAALADGERLYAFRWSSDAEPPSLYWSPLEGGVAISSEPFSVEGGGWRGVPANAMVTVCAADGGLRISDFAPA